MSVANESASPVISEPIVGTAAPEAAGEEEIAKDKQGQKAIWAIGGALVVALLAFGAWRGLTSSDQSTDNAVVEADVVAVAVRASGVVAQVRVLENSAVKEGDVLFTLDDAELAAKQRQAQASADAATASARVADAQVGIAEATARGGLSTAKAQVTTTRALADGAAAQIETARADLARRSAEAARAAADLSRVRSLVDAKGATDQQLDAVVAADAVAKAALLGSQAQLTGAEEANTAAHSRVLEAGGSLDANTPVDAKIEVARANAALAHANEAAAAAVLELAKIAHSYATITAPTDGIVSRFAVRAGQMVSAGQTAASIVPSTTFVVANFKETQVAEMKPGQPVDISVDGFPGQVFLGTVASIAPGTGSRFSMLAPDNASGNFVKVVQRVPVRIAWAVIPAGVQLRPGESAEVTVHTGG